MLSDHEAEIYQNIMRKEAMAKRLRTQLVEHIRSYEEDELTQQDHDTAAVDVALAGFPVVSCPYITAAEIPMPCCPLLCFMEWNFEP